MTTCADMAALVAYHLGELDEANEAALEEHYLGCDHCSRRLAEVESLAIGLRNVVVNGHVTAVFTSSFVDGLRSQGLRIREYRVPRNGSVNCSVGPLDQMLISRLQAPLEGVSRVDVIGLQGPAERLEDVPFDAAAGEIVLSPSVQYVRTLPAQSQVVRLMAVEPDGERLLGEYTFNHSQE